MLCIASTDKNQREIVEALRKAGATVALLHAVGNGVPDLLVGYRGQNILMEVKYKKGRLRPSQKAFMATWRGGEVYVVRTIDDALQAIGCSYSG